MITLRSTILAFTAAATFFATAAPAHSQQAPDNSGQNKSQSQTAENQSTAKADRETTAKIRRAIIADKGLSMYAHNVKIITANGEVTLKGPVKSSDEKQKVLDDVAAVISASQIKDQLAVKQ